MLHKRRRALLLCCGETRGVWTHAVQYSASGGRASLQLWALQSPFLPSLCGLCAPVLRRPLISADVVANIAAAAVPTAAAAAVPADVCVTSARGVIAFIVLTFVSAFVCTKYPRCVERAYALQHVRSQSASHSQCAVWLHVCPSVLRIRSINIS